ncbi:amidohydrolase family protein [Desertimonas flava]|uniref:amidohydrolase family protein n=1 Tax=Desertimonas flava TaxID=2064846 RepID=UPI000E355C00|nr:amidohydrolase family protein [Desertimonas flava]
MTATFAIVDALVEGRVSHVLWRDGTVVHVGAGHGRQRVAALAADAVVDAAGGELIPGLHDHHVHLAALAAARASVPVGPPDVIDRHGFTEALRQAAAGRPGWIRGFGYHESVAGHLDADLLDRLAGGDVPIRVQHRSGQMWVLNTAAMATTGVGALEHAGVERDAGGRPTGRLFGLDAWLRDRVARTPIDIAAVGRELAGYGVTGVTDMTPSAAGDDLTALAPAADPGFPVRVTITGGPDLPDDVLPAVPRGPVKILPTEHQAPDLDDLAARIVAGHARGRPVAIHCVTRVGLVVALAAWRVAGVHPGDRIEHGAVIPPELFGDIRDAGLLVVTQPNLVAERGDEYLTDVEPADLPDLWRLRSLLDAGIAVAGGTDPPFGHPDPWRAIAAASARRTRRGNLLGPGERVTARRALDLFLGTADHPTRLRRIASGERTDLCLLDAPLDDMLENPSSAAVRRTFGADLVRA